MIKSPRSKIGISLWGVLFWGTFSSWSICAEPGEQRIWSSIFDGIRRPLVKHIAFRQPEVKSRLQDQPPARSITHSGRLETIGTEGNQITVLYLQGTPYEMGYEHGRLLAPQVRETTKNVEAELIRRLSGVIPKGKKWLVSPGTERSLVHQTLDKAWAKMKPYVPKDKMEEMAGLAAGSGVPLKTIHRVHAFPDLSETSCSGLVAPPLVTSDGHTYQLRILDYAGNFDLEKRPLLIIYRPQQGNAYANIGWIGFVGVISGMNAKGVAVSEKGLGSPQGETLAGIPMPFLLDQVLRYANSAQEGAALIRAAQRTNSYLYIIGDPSGGAIGITTTPQDFFSWRPNEVEHIPTPEGDLSQIPDLVFGGLFHEKMKKALQEMKGKINEQSLQELSQKVANTTNLQTVIYRLEDGQIWMANRSGETRASDRPYVSFSLREAWEK